MRGVFSVSPKSLTVNTITPRRGGAPGGTPPDDHRARLSYGVPRGVEIFVNAAAWHVFPFLATMGHSRVLSQVISGAGPLGAARSPFGTHRIRAGFTSVPETMISGSRIRRNRRAACPRSQ
ncbi:hypothetical protein GCM10020227_60280 [Streptomyces flavovirens]